MTAMELEMQDAPAPLNRLTLDVDDIISKLATKDVSKLLQLDLIKQQLASIDHTPDHPVYPVMIQEAITDLDEEGGSTKDAISQFIINKYDVLGVVHLAKLIEQLDKLVKKEEIVFTSENRYMLPVENTTSLVNLQQGNKCEQDKTSNKLCKVHGGDQIQEDHNLIMEIETQPQIGELNGPPKVRIESSANKNQQIMVIKEQRPEVMEKVLEEEQHMQGQTIMLEGFHNNELNGPPGYQIEGFENHNHLQEEQVKVFKEQELEMTGELFSQVNEGRPQVIGKETCGHLEKGVDDQTHVEEMQACWMETEATEEQSRLQLQALNVVKDQLEAECQIKASEELCHVQHLESEEVKGRTQPEVQKSLHIKEYSQLEQNHIEAIGWQSKTQEQEVELTEEQKRLQEQHDEVANKTTDLSNMLELFTKKLGQDEAIISTPSSSRTSKKLDHVGPLLPSRSFKEKLLSLWKRIRGTEQELKEVINCLSTVEVSKHNGPHPMMGEGQIMPGSEPKSLSHSVYLNIDSMRHEMEKQEDFSSFKGHLEPCGPQKPSESSCLVVSSPCALMESEEIGQEQQSKHPQTIVKDLQIPINLEHAKQVQQLDLHSLKMALDKILSAIGELTTPMDITMNSKQVDHDKQIDCQISETSHNLEPELQAQERPTGLERIEEQLSHECLQQFILHDEAKKPEYEFEKEKQLQILIPERHLESELTTVEKLSQEQPQEVTLCHGARNHECKLVKEQQLEISVEERSTEVEIVVVEEQCQIKQQTQGQQLCLQGRGTSKSESSTFGTIHDQQPQNIERLQEPKQQIMVDESSQMMKKQQKSCGPGKQTQGEEQRRQLRPRGSRPSESDLTHTDTTDANDLDQTLSTIKLEKKKKLEPPFHKRPQKQRPKKVEGLSESDGEEVDHHGKQKRVRFQLSPITSDGLQIIETPAEFKPSVAEVLVQTPQQHQLLKHKLQPQIQCSSQAEQVADKIMAEPSLHHTEQQDQKKHRRRGRPPKLNSDLDRAERELPPLNGQNHCKRQPSQIKGRGRPPKANTSTQLTMREPHSDHQNHDKQQPEKRGRGRPPKSMIATHKIADVSLTSLHLSKQQQLGENQGSPPESKPDSAKTKVTLLPSKHVHQQQLQNPQGGGEGRVTRARAAATAANMSSLHSQHQKQQQPQQSWEEGKLHKRKIDEDTSFDNLLSSQSDQQQPKHQGQ